ncbi:hypothetical protein EON81_20040 [bacterium]|nr:MAG: hypothetical protein EON81_20040 [bacterium]
MDPALDDERNPAPDLASRYFVIATLLALTLGQTVLGQNPKIQAPKPGTRYPRLIVHRVVWLPTTAAYTSQDPALRPDWACQGADLGLTSGKKLPWEAVNMDVVKAAMKSKSVTSPTGASPEGTDEMWSSEGGLKVANQFKADYYGMVKLIKAFHQDDATGKYVEVQARYQLFNKFGKASTGLLSIRNRDTTKGGTSGSIGQAREAAFTIGSKLIPDWYRSHLGDLK